MGFGTDLLATFRTCSNQVAYGLKRLLRMMLTLPKRPFIVAGLLFMHQAMVLVEITESSVQLTVD
jgi:hypothetical protein